MFSLSDWVERFWLTFPGTFEPVQDFFNGDYFDTVADILVEFRGKRILDLGCGTGSLLRTISPTYYVGVDINQSFIQHARRTFAHKPHASFVCADVLNFCPDDRFDVVLISSMAHHFPDKQFAALLEHLAQHLRFKYLMVIDCQVAPTPVKPLLELLDMGADFREAKELKRYFPAHYTVKKWGSFTASRPYYSYPYVVGEKKKKS